MGEGVRKGFRKFENFPQPTINRDLTAGRLSIRFARVFPTVLRIRIVDHERNVGLVYDYLVFEAAGEQLFAIFVPADFRIGS